MEISTRIVQDTIVFETSGDIDSKTAPIFHEKVLAEGIRPGGKLILDMSKVEFISSAGLRSLLLIYKLSASAKGAVGIVGLSAEIQEGLSMTGLLGFFKLYDTVPEALAAL